MQIPQGSRCPHGYRHPAVNQGTIEHRFNQIRINYLEDFFDGRRAFLQRLIQAGALEAFLQSQADVDHLSRSVAGIQLKGLAGKAQAVKFFRFTGAQSPGQDLLFLLVEIPDDRLIRRREGDLMLVIALGLSSQGHFRRRQVARGDGEEVGEHFRGGLSDQIRLLRRSGQKPEIRNRVLVRPLSQYLKQLQSQARIVNVQSRQERRNDVLS